jgi:hypothetical protein
LTVHRSTRAVPHKFTVHPDGATVAANQAQRFEVTDSQGRPVAVRWNVTGLGCFGAACGTIDDQGVYRTPSSLPQPRVVIVEGVLVSDPNYSVLTRVRLEDATAVPASPASGLVAAGKIQEVTAPAVGRHNLAISAVAPPLPVPVAAAPVVGKQSLASTAALPPLPVPVAAAPVVGRQSLTSTALLPLPDAVAAAPVVGKQNLASIAESLPLPNAVAAAPVVERQSVALSAKLPPLPDPVAAAPAVARQSLASSAALTPLPVPVAAPPAVGRQNLAISASVLPLPAPVAAAPVVASQNLASRAGLPPLPAPVGAPPAVGKQSLASAAALPPLPVPVAAAPVVGTQKVARRTELPALPDAVAAAPAVGKQSLVISAAVLPLPVPAAAAPAIVRQSLAGSAKLPPLPNAVAAAPVVERHYLASNAASPVPVPVAAAPMVGKVLLPMADGGGAPPVGTVVSPQHADVVTYRDGQLTIDAENSTLAAVLELVAAKTGAVIEVPPGSGLERIVEHTGPGRADDVLAQLLNGSNFDFIIVGTPQRPHDPAQVLLSVRRAETVASPAAELPKIVSASPLWTPPAPAPAAAILPIPTDAGNLPPKESLTPEALGKMMREKAQQLRDQVQQQPQQ